MDECLAFAFFSFSLAFRTLLSSVRPYRRQDRAKRPCGSDLMHVFKKRRIEVYRLSFILLVLSLSRLRSIFFFLLFNDVKWGESLFPWEIKLVYFIYSQWCVAIWQTNKVRKKIYRSVTKQLDPISITDCIISRNLSNVAQQQANMLFTSASPYLPRLEDPVRDARGRARWWSV